MTDEELIRMLKSAVPPTDSRGPSRDLWPVVAGRVRTGPPASAFDVGILILAVVLLVLFPRAAWLIAYHL